MGRLALSFKPFPVKAEIRPGESLFGIIVSFCEANRLSPSELSAALGAGTQAWTCLVTGSEWAEALGRVTALSVAEIAARQILPKNTSHAHLQLAGESVPAKQVDLIYRRVAPSTYDKTGIHLEAWLNKVTMHDERTREPLVSQCSAGHPQLWVTVRRIGYCDHCGRRLCS